MSIEQMNTMNGKTCSCGRIHSFQADICTGKGAVDKLPHYIQKYNAGRAFIISDLNTYKAAGSRVCDILHKKNIDFTNFSFTHSPVEPDEYSVGSAIMHYDSGCDIIVGVGSGVVNDIGKIVSMVSGKPYIIVATAPSMDGYASASSSMTRDGLKISLPTRSADVIIGDTDILCQAPLHMMKSGLGDMLAKYVSICEWRIAHIITGEYCCEEIAQLIRSALKRCIDNAQGLLQRDPEAVQAVFEGLVIGGVAMNYAGLSRPASGVEHYISHVLDMRGVEFDTPVELHGIQCAIGTLLSVRLYEKIKKTVPYAEKAIKYAEAFDYNVWAKTLRAFLGKGAESMIALEDKEKKYDATLHKERLKVILNNWDSILKIIAEELPSSAEIESILDMIDAPKSLEAIGINEQDFPTIFKCTKDIRDKYVLSRLAWDLGVLDDILL